jgi:hypothetical protein
VVGIESDGALGGLVGVPTPVAPSRPCRGLEGCGAACVNGRFSVLSIAVSAQQLEADLAAGVLACPDCRGRLSRWGFARSREVRLRDGVQSVTPRRACCGGCGATHVLCPSWSVPRRRDGAEVIGEALRLAARGEGHRRIARRLDRPPGTVRGWLRAARARAESLRGCGVRCAYALDPGELVAVAPAGCELGDAVEAMMLAARAWVLRFGPQQTGPWERAVWLTGGLLYGRPGLPP